MKSARSVRRSSLRQRLFSVPRNRPRRRKATRRRLWPRAAALGAVLLASFLLARWQAGLMPSVQMGLPLDWETARALHARARGLAAHVAEALDWRAALRRDALRLLTIEVRGLRWLSAETVIEKLSFAPGVHLVDIDPDTVCGRLRAHGRIASCAAVRVPPGRLLLALEERSPVAVLRETRDAIDHTGARFAIEPDERGALPTIEGDLSRVVAVLDAARQVGVPLLRVAADESYGVSVWPADAPMRVRVGETPVTSFAAYRSLSRAELTRAAGVADLSTVELDLRFRGRIFLRAAPGVATGPTAMESAEHAEAAALAPKAARSDTMRAARERAGSERSESEEGGT
jgi:cell division protein FtsQ